MSNNNDSDFGFAAWDPRSILNEFHEENRIRQQEAQTRYQDRKNQKEAHRRKVEDAALKICDMIAAAPEPQRPEEIAALAAALSHTATAMHAAENYAESRPYYGYALGGLCGA